jgi:SAM-dependent methyltransferase
MTTDATTNAPKIFDRTLLAQRQRRAHALGAADFLLKHVTQDMAERLAVVLRTFENAADIDTPDAKLRDALRMSGKVQTIAAVALGDDESLPLADASLDLVVSALALQFVSDLPGVLAQIRRALKPDGLFMAALFGGDTLMELRDAFAEAESVVEGGISPRVAPFADVRQLGGLLQRAGFALPVVDSDRLTVRYDNALALMHDLRRMGAGNILVERRRTPLRRETLARAVQNYTDNYSDPDGRVRATFEIVWMSGWTPHPSQQQPLKPGSAKTRLADALNALQSEREEKPKS